MANKVARPALRRPIMAVAGILAMLLSISGPALAQDESPLPVLPPAGPDTTVQYVGVTSDPDVYVAVVDYGSHVKTYLCDGVDLGVWLTGDSTDGTATLGGADGSSGTVTIADGSATGSVTLADGATVTFVALTAVLPAGFYERAAVVDGEGVQARTIVLPDGTAKGTAKKYDCAGSRKIFKAIVANVESTTGAAQQEWTQDGLSQLAAARNAGCAWANPIVNPF